MPRPDCPHIEDEPATCQPGFLNTYQCAACNVSWTDTWSCGCDDECPECGKPIEPEKSVVLTDCACEVLG